MYDYYQQGIPGGFGPVLQFAPQGLLGGMLGGPLGGMIGRGIGGMFGNPSLGAQIGRAAGGIGGTLLPFGADPMSVYAQQPQFAPQGFFGNLIGQLGQPVGGAIGGAFGNAGMGSAIGGAVGQLGRMLPFGIDPMSMAMLQQAALEQQAMQQQAMQQQLAPQGFFGNLIGQLGQPVGSAIGGAFGNAGLGGAIGGAAGQLGRLLPFNVDPMSAAYLQQQFAPQGFFGNLIGRAAQPIGTTIGGAFGNPSLGGAIGNVAGQLGRMLPFGADPYAYWQQAAVYPGYAGFQGGAPALGGQQQGQPTIH